MVGVGSYLYLWGFEVFESELGALEGALRGYLGTAGDLIASAI